MKVKCVKFLDCFGNPIKNSPWLSLGRIYHVFSIFIDRDGERSYTINTSKNMHPELTNHRVDCFEVVSTRIPSNWVVWVHESSAMGVSPIEWQSDEFMRGVEDKDPIIIEKLTKDMQIMTEDDQ